MLKNVYLEITKHEKSPKHIFVIPDYILRRMFMVKGMIADTVIPYILYNERFKQMLSGLDVTRLYPLLKARKDLRSHWEI